MPGTPLLDFIEDLKNYGMENVLRLYYGIYRAHVLKNDDPEQRGRIQISCPEVGHNPLVPLPVWVSPAVDVTGPAMGWFNPPLVGSLCRVVFDNGDPSKPKAYWGGWFTDPTGASPLPSEFGYDAAGKPQRRGFRSRAGHVLQFNDEPGKEAVRIIWHKIPPTDPAALDPDAVCGNIAAGDDIAILSFDSDGSVQIKDKNGATIAMNATDKQTIVQDASGNLITMSKDGVVLMDNTSGGASVVHLNGKGDINLIASKNINLMAPNINLKTGGVFAGDGAAMSPAMAEILLPWLASHTHAGITAGPAASGPPAAPPPPAIKSSSLKVR